MPPLAGERWWRQPPKGGCISDARRAVVWFYTNWRLLSIHRRPTTTLAPKGETTHYDLCVALLLQIIFAVHARGASNLSPLRTFGPSVRQPSSPQGLSVRRQPPKGDCISSPVRAVVWFSCRRRRHFKLPSEPARSVGRTRAARGGARWRPESSEPGPQSGPWRSRPLPSRCARHPPLNGGGQVTGRRETHSLKSAAKPPPPLAPKARQT